MDHLSETILKLARLQIEGTAACKWPDEIVAYAKDWLETRHASYKDDLSAAKKNGIIGELISTADYAKVVAEISGIDDCFRDAIYEYILYVEEHPADRDGALTAYLDRITPPSLKERRRQSIDSIVNTMKSVFEVFNNELVEKALNYAFEADKGKMLLDGPPLIDRLICTAILLAGSSNSAAVVASGLLLDYPTCDMKEQHNALENTFGIEVASLVRDVSKLNKMSEVSRDEKLENPNLMPDLILAMAADARAVMIKIAEHIALMVALDRLKPEKKERFVNETLHVHIPLAERLGLNYWKNQLENLCVIASDELEKLYASVSEYDVDGIAFDAKLRDALNKEMLTDFCVESRKKSLRSISKKLHKYSSPEQEKNKTFEKNITFSDIRDIIGLRIIVENVEECYKAKDVVKKLWNADLEFEKDYIKNPKDGYRSLHISVKNGNDQYMEVQIRTKEMHMASDDSHWLYKEGDLQVSEYIKELVKFARLVNRKETKVTDVEGNSSPHQPACSYAKLNKPPCLDATGVCKFPGNKSVYAIVKAENKVTIEQHPIGTPLSTLCTQREWEGQVLVNEEDADLDYVLIVGDIIKFV